MQTLKQKNKDKKSPLHHAKCFKRPELGQLLLKYEEDSQARVKDKPVTLQLTGPN